MATSKKEEIALGDDEELARKLAAAYLAHVLGVKSIDRVRKVHIDSASAIAPDWIELAKHVKAIYHNTLNSIGESNRSR